ncbi:hypothetical protein XELAEV_18042797mg [Xenopus laevis]|uniref:Ig-like domain-containing protein n=1 Tax=Xenopus laevis TaxID=8355 RepID=A0A974C5I2_XENLA|nr:hypothetical protein XELAEV_18042797mg [Xenopus laevis]
MFLTSYWLGITGLDHSVSVVYLIVGHHHVHVYQRKYICELRDDGTFLGYHAFLFNGKEVIAFDKERETFVPITPEAAHLIPSWNQYLAGVKANKFYLENVCIKHLQLYLSYISTVLERKVPPKVKISVSISDRGKLLCCLVYGFHPKKVHVKVIKNGTEEVPPEELKHVLPNPDGTYQIRVSVRVTPGDGATYSCHVDHSSLENPLVVPFEPRENLYTIISFATAVVVLVVLGVFICRKKKDSGNTKQDNTHCPPCLKSSSSVHAGSDWAGGTLGKIPPANRSPPRRTIGSGPLTIGGTNVGSTFHFNQEITIPTFCPSLSNAKEAALHTLDPVRALKFYLHRVEDIRLSDSLFDLPSGPQRHTSY